MNRSLWLGLGLIAIHGLSGCASSPGVVCRDASGRSIENQGYCRLYPARHSEGRELASREAPPEEHLARQP